MYIPHVVKASDVLISEKEKVFNIKITYVKHPHQCWPWRIILTYAYLQLLRC